MAKVFPFKKPRAPGRTCSRRARTGAATTEKSLRKRAAVAGGACKENEDREHRERVARHGEDEIVANAQEHIARHPNGVGGAQREPAPEIMTDGEQRKNVSTTPLITRTHGRTLDVAKGIAQSDPGQPEFLVEILFKYFAKQRDRP